MCKFRPLQIMFLGTGSDVGKSVIAAGFCRILYRRGFKVAPFKAQNMALNSFVTMDGKEMGRAQVIQAYAAGILPDVDMNPVLLKPSGGNNTQIIIQGEVFKNADAHSYYSMIDVIRRRVIESYRRLTTHYDAIVLEGAGSTSEINLKDRDIVNISMAKRVKAPVVIVADIERGGVFASIIGTMKLLTRSEKNLVIGFVINKFRGSIELFKEGVEIIEVKTKRPVFGVVPYFRDIRIPEEDSVALEKGRKGSNKKNTQVAIAVIHLPYISNYTDFDPFEVEKDVSLWYAVKPGEIHDADVVIIPGTKCTVADLLWLRRMGFESALRFHVKDGKSLIGICGGYQMLGKAVEDPDNIESSNERVEGLGYLDVVTVMKRTKTLSRVRGICRLQGITSNTHHPVMVEGYEIHMGVSRLNSKNKPAFSILEDNSTRVKHNDGSISSNGLIWGTYLHGLFENDEFRDRFLAVHGRKLSCNLNYKAYLNSQYDKLADHLEKHLDINRILIAAQGYRRW